MKSDDPTELDKLICAQRELTYRRHVYPRLVREEKMTQRQADHELRCMEQIVIDYQKITRGERLI